MASRLRPPAALAEYLASVDASSPLAVRGRPPLPVVSRTGRGLGIAVLVGVVLVLLAFTCVAGIALAVHDRLGPLPAGRISPPTTRRLPGAPSAPVALLH